MEPVIKVPRCSTFRKSSRGRLASQSSSKVVVSLPATSFIRFQLGLADKFVVLSSSRVIIPQPLQETWNWTRTHTHTHSIRKPQKLQQWAFRACRIIKRDGTPHYYSLNWWRIRASFVKLEGNCWPGELTTSTRSSRQPKKDGQPDQKVIRPISREQPPRKDRRISTRSSLCFMNISRLQRIDWNLRWKPQFWLGTLTSRDLNFCSRTDHREINSLGRSEHKHRPDELSPQRLSKYTERTLQQ